MPNSAEHPRKHHYIPVFYLRPWCRKKDARLAQFHRVGPTKRLFKKWVCPTETGYKEHLYTLPNLEPENQNWLETEFLGLVDRNSAEARNKLIAHEDLSPDLRDSWCRFIMSMIHRNPEKIAEISKVWYEGYDDLTRRLEPRYDELRQEGDPPNYAAYVVSQKQGTKERLFANLIKGMMDSEPIGLALNNMKWAVWDFPHTWRTLMTSDRPIVMPHGLAHDDSYVGVALSPRHMFIACNNRERYDFILRDISGEKLVAAHNEAVVRQAKDYVYAASHFEESFVDSRLGHQPPQFIGWTSGQYKKPDGWDTVPQSQGKFPAAPDNR